MISASDFRKGVTVEIDGNIYTVVEFLHVKPGKGSAFVRTKIKNIITGAVLVFTGAMTAYTTPQLLGGPKNMLLSTLIYQRAMTLNDWTGASVVALVMIVTTLIVMKGLNAIAGRLDKRGEN